MRTQPVVAGYVLVGSGTQDSTTLISAVLGTPNEPTRDADTLKSHDVPVLLNVLRLPRRRAAWNHGL